MLSARGDAGEVTSWVVSKWAPFMTPAIRNILGQTKSGFDLRDIMDNRKSCSSNLSKVSSVKRTPSCWV